MKETFNVFFSFQERAIANFAEADPEYGRRIKENIERYSTEEYSVYV